MNTNLATSQPHLSKASNTVISSFFRALNILNNVLTSFKIKNANRLGGVLKGKWEKSDYFILGSMQYSIRY